MLVYHILSLDKLVSGIILFVLLILIVNSKLEVLVLLYNCRVQVSFETGFKAFCRGLVTLDLVNYFILEVSEHFGTHVCIYIYFFIYFYTHTHTHLLPPQGCAGTANLRYRRQTEAMGARRKAMDLTNLVDDS